MFKALPLRLQIYKYRTSRYKELKQFIQDVQTQIDKTKDVRKEVFEEEIKELEQLEEEEKQYLMDIAYKNYFTFEQLYLDTPIKSTLVMACSYLEYQMRDLKVLLDKHLIVKKKSDNGKKEIENMSIKELRISIYKMTGLDFTSLDVLWASIYKYIQVRNIIVHSGLELTKPEHFRIISLVPEFEIDGRNFYLKEPKEIFKIIDSFNEYVTGLAEILLTNLDKNNMT